MWVSGRTSRLGEEVRRRCVGGRHKEGVSRTQKGTGRAVHHHFHFIFLHLVTGSRDCCRSSSGEFNFSLFLPFSNVSALFNIFLFFCVDKFVCYDNKKKLFKLYKGFPKKVAKENMNEVNLSNI